ncbi:hypothetical protein ACFVHB_17485 [Kitasatospora sp. NPDC127111]|uniref:hypothetical protein n=1 Tax=Kitasatospora sp. NPDC127111 TaxID=3345363 RepID=UPI0036447251
MSRTDLPHGLRDEAQRRRVRPALHDRLADDREQPECRYLMRLFWQLSMPYEEVAVEQLRRHVDPDELLVVEAMIRAVRTSPERVDAWVTAVEPGCDVTEDRGATPAAANRPRTGDADLPAQPRAPVSAPTPQRRR